MIKSNKNTLEKLYIACVAGVAGSFLGIVGVAIIGVVALFYIFIAEPLYFKWKWRKNGDYIIKVTGEYFDENNQNYKTLFVLASYDFGHWRIRKVNAENSSIDLLSSLTEESLQNLNFFSFSKFRDDMKI